MPLSIIIVTYNSADVIRNCIESVFNLSGEIGEIETIIIDNASSDETIEMLAEYRLRLFLVENKANMGFAAAVNQGMRLSKGDIILLLNPDTILLPGSLKAIVDFFGEYHDAAIVGGSHQTSEGIHQPSIWKIPTLSPLFFEMALPYAWHLPLISRKLNQTSEVEAVSGACMAIQRKAMEQLNGFDTRFFMYYEDIDFCLRAAQQGLKVYFTPHINIVHHLSASSWQDKESFFLRYFKSKLRFYQLHYSKGYFLVVKILLAAGISLRIAAYSFVGYVLFSSKFRAYASYYRAVFKTLLLNTGF